MGARKDRNICDNLFVINAVLNNVSTKKLKDTDIAIYELGFQNDKLNLLYEEKMNAKVAVKTMAGTTRRMNISEIIMQGTVWGSLMCIGTIDKLWKLAYSFPDILYKYKGIPIPPLGMVDDILTVSSVENSSDMNNLINSFIEHKKLKLSDTKCFRIHIGKGHHNCPDMKVHGWPMIDADKEKYLGDVIEEKKWYNPSNHESQKSPRGMV